MLGNRAFYVEHVVGDMEIPMVLNGSKMHGEVDETNLVPADLGEDEEEFAAYEAAGLYAEDDREFEDAEAAAGIPAQQHREV
jgi:hypothetical protein